MTEGGLPPEQQQDKSATFVFTDYAGPQCNGHRIEIAFPVGECLDFSIVAEEVAEPDLLFTRKTISKYEVKGSRDSDVEMQDNLTHIAVSRSCLEGKPSLRWCRDSACKACVETGLVNEKTCAGSLSGLGHKGNTRSGMWRCQPAQGAIAAGDRSGAAEDAIAAGNGSGAAEDAIAAGDRSGAAAPAPGRLAAAAAALLLLGVPRGRG